MARFYPTFTICRKDRVLRGSEVTLGIKSVLPFKQLSPPNDIELVAIEIDCKEPIIACVLYIPPMASHTYHIQIHNFYAPFLLKEI